MLAVAALMGGIALILFFAIFVLNRPFGGDLRVGPDAFELVLSYIEGNGNQ